MGNFGGKTQMGTKAEIYVRGSKKQPGKGYQEIKIPGKDEIKLVF